MVYSVLYKRHPIWHPNLGLKAPFFGAFFVYLGKVITKIIVNMKNKLFALLVGAVLAFSSVCCSSSSEDESFNFAGRCWKEVISVPGIEEEIYMYYENGVLYSCEFSAADSSYNVTKEYITINGPKTSKYTIFVSGDYCSITENESGLTAEFNAVDLPEGFAANM